MVEIKLIRNRMLPPPGGGAGHLININFSDVSLVWSRIDPFTSVFPHAISGTSIAMNYEQETFLLKQRRFMKTKILIEAFIFFESDVDVCVSYASFLFPLQCATRDLTAESHSEARLFLTADTDDIHTTAEGVQLTGRPPVLARKMRTDLNNVRLPIHALSRSILLLERRHGENANRNWNVLGVDNAESSQGYVCGVGTVCLLF